MRIRSFSRNWLFVWELLLLVAVSSVHAWVQPSQGTVRSAPRTYQTLLNAEPPRHSLIPQAIEDWFQRASSACQTAVATAVVGGVLLLGPAVDDAHAQAADIHSVTPLSSLISVVTQANVIEDVNLPKPDAIGTVDEGGAISIEPVKLKQQQEEETSVLDEVWTLIDKYYIDPTFGGKTDWNQVREKYRFLSQKAPSDEARFNLVKEMVASLNDRYSRILDPQQYAAIQKYDLIGVGVTLMPDANKRIIVGAPPIANSEAARVGMHVGDFVTAINGIPTEGRTAFDIIDQISEQPNARTVSMTVRPKNSAPDSRGRELSMERTFQEVKNPVRYKISESRSDGTVVGFVKILEFNSLVKGSLETALAELEAAGANAYVLDIRQNTGGAFQSAVEISGLFTQDKIATYVVDSTDTKLPFRTAKSKLAIEQDDPLVIWIDGRSASASEVLAGSLHDNCRAVLMGEKSFGKGLIQAVYGLKNGAGLVLTVARYMTPSGNDIQGIGITPDLGKQNLPFGPLGIGTDTSKIDFADIKARLSESSCKVPAELL